jgi:DNA repair photolyase
VIISASRRTDIPAFYGEWFMNRVRAGFCDVPNPFNPAQAARVSLLPEDVEAIVFWTRHAAPLLPHLAELESRGYRYCFLYTLLDYPPLLDPHTPPLSERIDAFRRVADRVGPNRIAWRYDPIVLSDRTPPEFHREAYERLAGQLNGAANRSIVSFVDVYRKLTKRLRWLAEQGCAVREPGETERTELAMFMAKCARKHGMEAVSCAEPHNLTQWGIAPGKCIDAEKLSAAFGIHLSARKDPGQRQACGCAVSKDIGCYDTCLHGCRYCYATSNPDRARKRHRAHDPKAASLVAPPDSPP